MTAKPPLGEDYDILTMKCIGCPFHNPLTTHGCTMNPCIHDIPQLESGEIEQNEAIVLVGTCIGCKTPGAGRLVKMWGDSEELICETCINRCVTLAKELREENIK